MDTLLPSCAAIPWTWSSGAWSQRPGRGPVGRDPGRRRCSPLLSRVGNPLAAKRKIRWRTSPHIHRVLPPVGSLQREPLERSLAAERVRAAGRLHRDIVCARDHGYLRSSEAIGSLSRVAAHHYIEMGVLAQLPLRCQPRASHRHDVESPQAGSPRRPGLQRVPSPRGSNGLA